ncbi:Lsr2 family protein [Microbispora hainanensis]|uniref:Lsr2 family protein n=1 Tax=Microbispora hainanensis TaxID=568844 RepID=A0ABZ1SP63_9ACTN|nr:MULTISPECIES: Lsr2 family protein [Microbispora]NJP29200.1 Lsr2 family protein [Microbispora sp. CL1-1]TQS06019.1 Lsr2 family protein [Microbispora sp. SCL1-1]
MAQKVILVDDLDHSEGDDVARREFPLLNRTFAIDLSDANHQRLSEALAFIEEVLENAREVKQASRSKKAADTSPRLRGYTLTDVREWAREQGLDVPARGKMADEVIEQFIAAHPDASTEDAAEDAAAEAAVAEAAEKVAEQAAPRAEATAGV